MKKHLILVAVLFSGLTAVSCVHETVHDAQSDLLIKADQEVRKID